MVPARPAVVIHCITTCANLRRTNKRQDNLKQYRLTHSGQILITMAMENKHPEYSKTESA
jgi:hypothetical protein